MRKLIIHLFISSFFLGLNNSVFSQNIQKDPIQITENNAGTITGVVHFSTSENNEKKYAVVLSGNGLTKQVITDKFFEFKVIPKGEYLITVICNPNYKFIYVTVN